MLPEINQGLSLLEMMLAIILISTLALAAGDNWYRYRQAVVLDSASAQLMDFLLKVQRQAAGANINLQIDVYDHQTLSGLSVFDLNSQRTLEKLRFIIMEKALTLQQASISSPIIFYGRRNMASSGRFIISGPNGKIHVIVSSLGRIRRCIKTDSTDLKRFSVAGIAEC
jgi:prepilin-type N-terminal cleavage/methylation domain-containing protein